VTGVKTAVLRRVVRAGLNGVIVEWSDSALSSVAAIILLGRVPFRRSSLLQHSFLICTTLGLRFRAQMFGRGSSPFLAMSSGEVRPFDDAHDMGFGGLTIGPGKTLSSRCPSGWYPNHLQRSTSDVYSRMLRIVAS